jgi:stalled ribosome rescue protein Dom34
MTDHPHAVVWLDSSSARIFRIDDQDIDKSRIRANEPNREVRHRSGNVGDGLGRDNREYFEAILAELDDVDRWLIVGPGETKKDFQKYVDGHAEVLRKKLCGIGPMERPSDGELLAHARAAFKTIDQLSTGGGPRIERATDSRN